MEPHAFTATLWRYDAADPGSWYFLTLPRDVADDVVAEGGPRRGFGSIRVEVTLGATTWRTSLFPDSQRGSLLLPVKKQVRVAEGLDEEAPCRVSLRVVSTG